MQYQNRGILMLTGNLGEKALKRLPIILYRQKRWPRGPSTSGMNCAVCKGHARPESYLLSEFKSFVATIIYIVFIDIIFPLELIISKLQ